MTSLTFNGCTGGGARMEAPEQALSAPVPPGWEGQNGLPTTVSLYALFCEHVSIGEFERGPVQLVVESHGKFAAPATCQEGDYTFMNVLTRIVWSDEEIADAMQAELGIPTSVGVIERQMIGPDTSQIVTFAWTIDGQESYFQVGRISNEIQPNENTYRYVWANAGSLGLMDFRWDVEQTQFEPTLSIGSFAPPMMLAEVGLPVAGVGVADDETFPGGDIKFFEGYECATQVSP